jgi:hypothetical protein
METFHEAWRAALDELEVDLATAEQTLRLDRISEQPRRAWTPPSGLGPIPADLVVRARALRDRQLEVSRRLAESVALSRRQLDASRRLRQRAEAAPVYLDLPA